MATIHKRSWTKFVSIPQKVVKIIGLNAHKVMDTALVQGLCRYYRIFAYWAGLAPDWVWLVMTAVSVVGGLEFLHNSLYPIPSVMAQQLWAHRTEVLIGILVSSRHVLVGLASAYLIGYPLGMMIPLFKKAHAALAEIGFMIFGISRYAWAMITMIIVSDEKITIIDGLIVLTRADLFCIILGVLYSLETGRSAAAEIVLRDPNTGNQHPLMDAFEALSFRRRYHKFRLLLWPMTRHSRIGTMIVISNFLWMSMIYVEPMLDSQGYGLGQITNDALASYASFGLFYGGLIVTALFYVVTATVLRFFQEKGSLRKQPRHG